MIDFNNDGRTDVAELTAMLGFALHLDRQARQRLNRKLAAMSSHDRAWFVAKERLRARCRGHLGMRRGEWNAVARYMNRIVEQYQLTPEEGFQWWLSNGEQYWYQSGGRREWYR